MLAGMFSSHMRSAVVALTPCGLLRALLACVVLAGSITAGEAAGGAAPGGAAAGQATITTDLVYGAVGTRQLKFDLALPAAQGPVPLVLSLHGGGWREGSYHMNPVEMRRYTDQGLACASVEYRLSTEARWPAQIQDLHLALSYLAAHGAERGIDPRRVVLLGHSAGGHLALRLGFDPAVPAGIAIRGIVSMDGPTHLGNSTGLSPEKMLTAQLLVQALLGTKDLSDPLFADASPLLWVRPALPPVLLLHGTNDDIVPLSQSESLLSALRRVQVDATLVKGAGGGHEPWKWPAAERDRAFVAVRDFILRVARP
jgi:acetyl esterase/lipase